MTVRQILALPSFRCLWIAQSVSLCGDLLAAFALQSAVVFRLHGTARQASGVFLVALFPIVILGPLAGVFADRWDPRRTMIASDLVRAALLLLLAFAHNLREIYAISFAVGCGSSFFLPAQAIAVPRLVGPEGFLPASTLLQQTAQLVRIVIPALAAAVVAALGERACYIADSASFLCSAILLNTLVYPPRIPAVSASSARMSVLAKDFRAGVRFLFTHHQLHLVVLAMFAGTLAAGCFSALMPLYIRDVLRAEPLLLGSFGSLTALGAIVGSAGMRRWGKQFTAGTLLGSGMAVVGAAILLLALLAKVLVALLAALAIGLGVAVVMAAVSVTLQGQTPHALRGRVSSASAALASLAQLLGYAVAGNAAAWLGVRGVFAISALQLIAIAFIVLRAVARCSPSRSAADSRSAPGGN